MDCCQNNLGSFPHNENIDTGVVAQENGYHKLEFTGANFIKFSLIYYFFYGANIIIPQGKLNEDMLYKLQIKQPSGTNLEVNECDNFILKTYIQAISCNDCGEDVYDEETTITIIVETPL